MLRLRCVRAWAVPRVVRPGSYTAVQTMGWCTASDSQGSDKLSERGGRAKQRWGVNDITANTNAPRVKSVERHLQKAKDDLLSADQYETLGAASRAAPDPETKFVKDKSLGLVKDSTGKTKAVPLFTRKRWTKEDLHSGRSAAANFAKRRQETIKSDKETRERSVKATREQLRKAMHLRRTQGSVLRYDRDAPLPLAPPLSKEEEKEAQELMALEDKDSPEYVDVITAKRRRMEGVTAWAKKNHPDIANRIITRIALKESLKGKPWAPSLLLTYEQMDEMRMKHTDLPDVWTTKVLAQKYRVSMTAVNKILHNKFQPTAEQRVIRRMEVGSFWGLVASQKKRKARKVREVIVDEDLKERYGDLYLSENKSRGRDIAGEEEAEIVFDEETIARYEIGGEYEQLDEGEEADEELTIVKRENAEREFEEELRREEAVSEVKGELASDEKRDVDIGEAALKEEEREERLFQIHERDIDEWLSRGETVTKRNILLEAKELVRHKLRKMHLPRYQMARATFEKEVSEERKRIAELRWLETLGKTPQEREEEKARQRSFWNLARFKAEAPSDGGSGIAQGRERNRIGAKWVKRTKGEKRAEGGGERQRREERGEWNERGRGRNKREERGMRQERGAREERGARDERRGSRYGRGCQEERGENKYESGDRKRDYAAKKAEEKTEVTTRRLKKALDGGQDGPDVPGMTKRKYIRWKTSFDP